MTRFRHDLILRMTKLLDAVLVTIPFAMCWYLYYAKHVASPYYAMGDSSTRNLSGVMKLHRRCSGMS